MADWARISSWGAGWRDFTAKIGVAVGFEYDVSFLKVVENVIGYNIDAMNLFVIENRVWILSLERWHSINLLWLMLEDIGDEDILAKVRRQILTALDLDAEEDLFIK